MDLNKEYNTFIRCKKIYTFIRFQLYSFPEIKFDITEYKFNYFNENCNINFLVHLI